jgi:hypothetical protein
VEDWEFFFRVEPSGSALYFVDLGLRDRVEPRRPWLVEVRYPLRTPRSDGLADESEGQALDALEDELFGALTGSLRARYVARITAAGTRRHFYYAPTTTGLDDLVRAVVEKHPDYPATHNSRQDTHWSVYRDDLFPRGLELQSITTRQLVDQYRSAGHDVTLPRMLVHTCAFPSEETCDTLLGQVAGHGFDAQCGELGESGDPELPYPLELRRKSTLEWELLDGAVADLFLRTETAGGRYDGWRVEE